MRRHRRGRRLRVPATGLGAGRAGPGRPPACGGSSGADAQVASAGGGDDGAKDAEDDGHAQADAEQAGLDFARCMREHGVDMPDPQVGRRRRSSWSARPSAAAAATPVAGAGRPGEACPRSSRRPTRPAATSSTTSSRTAGPPIDAEAQDRALKFARCMREHGVDMPDPDFSGGGRRRSGSRSAGRAAASTPRRETFQDAQKACGELFGPGRAGTAAGPGWSGRRAGRGREPAGKRRRRPAGRRSTARRLGPGSPRPVDPSRADRAGPAAGPGCGGQGGGPGRGGRPAGHGGRGGRVAGRDRRAASDGRRPGPATSTAKVTRQDLVARTEVDGTLGYAGEMTRAQPGPGHGDRRARGRARSSSGARRCTRWPTGPSPCSTATCRRGAGWPQDVDGADILQLEQNLVALGHATESEMLVDGKFTAATTTAVKRWQKAHGRGADGRGRAGPGRVPARRPAGGGGEGRGRRRGPARGPGAVGHVHQPGGARSTSTPPGSRW